VILACNPSYVGFTGVLQPEASPGKKFQTFSKKRTGGMTQVIQLQYSKHRALISKFSIVKKEKK
jgi:hypothetical protein